MLDKINGLPAHVLLVHAVVILVPLAALLAVLGVLWPAARRRLGFLIPLTALAGAGCVPLATNAGEWLQEHVAETPLVERHVEMGEGLLPWAVALFLLSAGVWLLDRTDPESRWLPNFLLARWVRAPIAVLVVAVAVISTVQVYRIGDSGAKATWNGRVNSARNNER
jgi:hypothetical protein